MYKSAQKKRESLKKRNGKIVSHITVKSILLTFTRSWRKKTQVWKSRRRSLKVWKTETSRIRREWPQSRGSSVEDHNVIPHYPKSQDQRSIAAGKQIREIF